MLSPRAFFSMILIDKIRSVNLLPSGMFVGDYQWDLICLNFTSVGYRHPLPRQQMHNCLEETDTAHAGTSPWQLKTFSVSLGVDSSVCHTTRIWLVILFMPCKVAWFFFNFLKMLQLEWKRKLACVTQGNRTDSAVPLECHRVLPFWSHISK